MEYVLLVLNIGFLLGVCYYSYIMGDELDAMRIRIVQLSSACQLAEIQTGRPYFTSLGNKLASCEVANEVYEIARQRLQRLGNENSEQM